MSEFTTVPKLARRVLEITFETICEWEYVFGHAFLVCIHRVYRRDVILSCISVGMKHHKPRIQTSVYGGVLNWQIQANCLSLDYFLITENPRVEERAGRNSPTSSHIWTGLCSSSSSVGVSRNGWKQWGCYAISSYPIPSTTVHGNPLTRLLSTSRNPFRRWRMNWRINSLS